MTAKKRRLFVNAVTCTLAGPFVTMIIYGVIWVLARPKPQDAPFMLRAFLFLGVVLGIILCVGYLFIAAMEAIEYRKKPDGGKLRPPQ